MAKDAKGHGSNTKGWGHEQHAAEAMRLYKAANLHPDKRAATEMRAKGHEHAAEAKHMLVSERRRAAAVTPWQKMGYSEPPKLKAGSKVRSTTQNRKY